MLSTLRTFLLKRPSVSYVPFPGADTIGGDIDICVVTKHVGFSWVRRKHYFNTALNPAEVSYGARYPIGKEKHDHSQGHKPVQPVYRYQQDDAATPSAKFDASPKTHSSFKGNGLVETWLSAKRRNASVINPPSLAGFLLPVDSGHSKESAHRDH
jgi:hypothetical protein